MCLQYFLFAFLGDWLRLEIQKSVKRESIPNNEDEDFQIAEDIPSKILSIQPTRQKTIVGNVQSDESCVSINGDIYFTNQEVINTRRHLGHGDEVKCIAIESEQYIGRKQFNFRAVTVVPYNFTKKFHKRYLIRGYANETF